MLVVGTQLKLKHAAAETELALLCCKDVNAIMSCTVYSRVYGIVFSGSVDKLIDGLKSLLDFLLGKSPFFLGLG